MPDGDEFVDLAMFLELLENHPGLVPCEIVEINGIKSQKFFNTNNSRYAIICIQDDHLTKYECERHLDKLDLYYALHGGLEAIALRG